MHGDIVIGGGKISMKNIRGKHDRTWMACAGDGNYNAAGWNVRLFDLLAGSVVLDDDLMGALPGQLARSVEGPEFQRTI